MGIFCEDEFVVGVSGRESYCQKARSVPGRFVKGEIGALNFGPCDRIRYQAESADMIAKGYAVSVFLRQGTGQVHCPAPCGG